MCFNWVLNALLDASAYQAYDLNINIFVLRISGSGKPVPTMVAAFGRGVLFQVCLLTRRMPDMYSSVYSILED